MQEYGEEKIVISYDYKDISEQVKIDRVNKIFILHDLYAIALANKIKEEIKKKI